MSKVRLIDRDNIFTLFLLILFVYVIGIGACIIIYSHYTEAATWDAVRAQGITVRDDAVINSPTIIYKVNLTQFITLAKQYNLEAFFIPHTSSTPLSNELVLVKDVQTGYIIIPTEHVDVFRLFTFQNPYG